MEQAITFLIWSLYAYCPCFVLFIKITTFVQQLKFKLQPKFSNFYWKRFVFTILRWIHNIQYLIYEHVKQAFFVSNYSVYIECTINKNKSILILPQSMKKVISVHSIYFFFTYLSRMLFINKKQLLISICLS